MKLFYKISQTWVWQMMFVFPVILWFFPVPLVVPICIVGMVIDQPEEFPVLIIFLVASWVGLLTTFIEDKMNKK